MLRYSMGRPRGFGPRGNAWSIAAISSFDRSSAPAAAFSAACSALDALGIASSDGPRVRKASATCHGDAMPLAPGNDGVLDRAFFQVIEHLIARDLPLAGHSEQFIEIVAVEIADTPGADLACALQLLECSDRILERIGARPMQQITVEPVGVEALQRALAGSDGAAPRCVARQHLGDEIHLVAAAGDGIGNYQLGIAIHLGGVDMSHPEIEAPLQRRDGALAV